MCLIGLAAFVWNVLTSAFRQVVVPVGIQCRVSSVYRFATWGAVSIGAVVGGWTASLLGQRAPFMVAALGLAAACVVGLPRLTNARLKAAATAGFLANVARVEGAADRVRG
jgi:hypothetical protein